jgi:hypothetical protein
VSLACYEPLPTPGDPVRRRWPRLLRPISWALAPRKRGVASAFQAEVAAAGPATPSLLPGRRGDRLARDYAQGPPSSVRPGGHTKKMGGCRPPLRPRGPGLSTAKADESA